MSDGTSTVSTVLRGSAEMRVGRWIGGLLLMVAILGCVSFALIELGVHAGVALFVGLLASNVVEPDSYARVAIRRVRSRRRSPGPPSRRT